MIRLLVIDETLKGQVARLVAYAAEHHYIPTESGEPPGDNPRHVMQTQFGYRCVFSFTRMPEALYRDLSVSAKDKFPNEFAFYTLAREFGFTGWDGVTILPAPEGWMMAKDVDCDAIRVVQKID